MASQTELVAYLRFALEELTARNGQYDFEALCQEVIRARVASNLITATGAVSARGDQGRDGETYVTYLQRELGPHSAFLARVSDKMAAICCTIQRDGLQAKFVSDAKKVVESGAPVERVYVMCSIPVAVGVRHDIETAVGEAAGVPVTLFDGVWIAQQLADPALVWIGKHYLDLADEMVPAQPPAPEFDNGYADLRDRWREAQAPRPQLGDFQELRSGLRAAKEPGLARADLPFWLSRMEALLAADAPADIASRAHYEIAVATLIGQRDLRPADHHVVALFDDVESLEYPFRLIELETLLMFLYGMVGAGQSSILPAQLKAWQESLRSRLADLVASDPPPTARAYYQYLLGKLGLHIDADLIEVPNEPEELPEIDEIRAAVGSGEIVPDATGLRDPASTVLTWHALLNDLRVGNLFPLERLADTASLMTGALVDQPGWSDFTGALDEALARSTSRATAAEQAFARGRRLEVLGRPLDAVRELHSAKVEWFAGDTARESAIALLGLADCYLQLRLAPAAKQHALAAAYLGLVTDLDAVRDLAPGALLEATRAEYACGNWASAIRVAAAGLEEVGEQSGAGEAGNPSEVARHLVQIFSTITAAARDLGHDFERALDPLFAAAESPDLRGLMLGNVEPATRDDWLARAEEEELFDVPFADAGAQPEIRFAALGLEWRIAGLDVTSETRGAAERLAAAACVLSAELAHHDLVLVPGEVRVGVAVREWEPDDGDVDADIEPGKDVDWLVTLHGGSAWFNAPDRLTGELTTILLTIFGDRALLPLEQLRETIKGVMDAGSISKVFVVRAYDELLATIGFVPEVRVETPPPSTRCNPQPHPALTWNDGPGPTYDEEQARVHLRSRYERLPPPIRLTLPRLLANAEVAERLRHLRRRGWLDWQILQAVHGIVLNHRLTGEAFDWPRERLEEFALAPETAEMAAVPLDAFTSDALDRSGSVGMLATLDVWHLENRSHRPDLLGVERALATRYRHRTDDIPHDDPLGVVEA